MRISRHTCMSLISISRATNLFRVVNLLTRQERIVRYPSPMWVIDVSRSGVYLSAVFQNSTCTIAVVSGLKFKTPGLEMSGTHDPCANIVCAGGHCHPRHFNAEGRVRGRVWSGWPDPGARHVGEKCGGTVCINPSSVRALTTRGPCVLVTQRLCVLITQYLRDFFTHPTVLVVLYRSSPTGVAQWNGFIAWIARAAICWGEIVCAHERQKYIYKASSSFLEQHVSWRHHCRTRDDT